MNSLTTQNATTQNATTEKTMTKNLMTENLMTMPTYWVDPTDILSDSTGCMVGALDANATSTVAPAAPQSLYQQALGPDFDRLHPRMKQRFGFSSADRVAHIGRGVMSSIERTSRAAVPFLYVGTLRNLLFPDRGTDVPFTIENYAYVDSLGRETMTWYRTFRFPRRTRIFEATMIFNERRNKIVDYLGTHQHVAADLGAWVDDEGGMNFVSGEQRFYERLLSFRLPALLTGQAHVREWWDEDLGQYCIDVHVTNRLLGTILRYRGSFDLEILPIADEDDVPKYVRPRREEARD